MSAAQTAGYSGTPLARKLGVKEGFRILVDGGPPRYLDLIAPAPAGVTLVQDPANADLIHLFTTQAPELNGKLERYRAAMPQDGILWVSWPKKAAEVPTDVTEDTVREVALPIGLVDVKVCAVDEVWSGLKLVIRRELRQR